MQLCTQQLGHELDARREGGYAALWILIIVALCGVAGLAIASLEPDTEIPILPVAGCVGVVAIGFFVELRYDRYEFFKNAGFIALVGAAGCGLVAGLGQASHPLALASSVVLGVSCIGAFVTSYRMAHAEEVVPNALLEIFDKSELSEIGGVQFASTHSDLQVPAGGEMTVTVHAQNGMDAERSFEIRLKPRADIGKGGPELRQAGKPGAASGRGGHPDDPGERPPEGAGQLPDHGRTACEGQRWRTTARFPGACLLSAGQRRHAVSGTLHGNVRLGRWPYDHAEGRQEQAVERHAR